MTEADAGMYHCVAKSSAGEAMGSPVEITTGKTSLDQTGLDQTSLDQTRLDY